MLHMTKKYDIYIVMISNLFWMISQIQYRAIYINMLAKHKWHIYCLNDTPQIFTLSYNNQHQSLFVCQCKVLFHHLIHTHSHYFSQEETLSIALICWDLPCESRLRVSKWDSGVEILLVSARELGLIHGAEVQEVGGAMDLVVELLGVGQLELILHVGVMSHTWKGQGQHQ